MSRGSAALKALTDLRHIPLHGLRFRLVDAKAQIVGHLASEIAILLQGKDKPLYSPKKNVGDVVIVVNAAHVHFTHDSWNTKLYRWHTGYPGGLKERTAVKQWDRDPTKILRDAVEGMLPKNKTQVYRMEKLKVFPEAEHPFTDFNLVPYFPRVRAVKVPGVGWPLPPGLEPVNPEKYGFRSKVSPELDSAPPGEFDFTTLMTEEERELWQRQQQQQQQVPR